MAKALIELVKKQFPGAVLASHSQHGDETIVVDPASYNAICRFLRDSPQADMSMLADLCGVDYPDREPRFEVVAHLYSLSKGHRLRVKTQVGDAEGEVVECETLTDLWAAANWLERQAYDHYGIVFKGHPDLRRILLYPEFIGYPLRKDYPADKIQPLVPYRDVPNVDKLPPFGVDEGMPFGRQTFARTEAETDDESQVN